MNSMSAEHSDLPEIQRALSLILETDAVAELRVPHTGKGTASGYFNDLNKLALAAAGLSAVGPGVYINPQSRQAPLDSSFGKPHYVLCKKYHGRWGHHPATLVPS